MRLIVILVTLLIVSYAIHQQIGPERAPGIPAVEKETAILVPRVPQRIEDLGPFETQMRKFVDESARERQRRMEETDP